MFVKTLIRQGEYYDSVKLMIATRNIADLEGVDEAAIVMGSELNKEILERTGLITEESRNAVPEDLIISIRAVSQEVLDQAFAQVDGLLHQRNDGNDGDDYRPKTLESAVKMNPDSNFCIISVPGRYAKNEAMGALKKGMHVLLFSDNVTIQEELELKTYAKENNLFLMGPDCGTAMFNNVPLGFANKVRKGSIGLIAAAGTGLQEVMTLVHKQGGGVSQAIGTGGRDLSKDIGGITMLQGLEALNKDKNTEVIVLISKPPAAEIAEKILAYVKENVNKPTIVNFIGGELKEFDKENMFSAANLEEAALKAVSLAKGLNATNSELVSMDDLENLAKEEAKKLTENQKYLRGLYSGGTLNYESMLVLKDFVGDVYSNAPLNKKKKLEDVYKPIEHTCIDLGEDEFTVGRPHPMIDTSLREQVFDKEVMDSEVGVVLFDIVIGYGTHSNPAKIFANKVKKAKAKLEEMGRHVTFISSVCGTEEDPQNLHSQQELLKEAGVIVMPSNAAAAKLAGMILQNR